MDYCSLWYHIQFILFTKNVIHINIYTLMTVLYCRELVYYYVCVR